MRNLNVEFLRGILMIWIVLFHYTTRYNQLFSGTYPFEFENGGIVGVTFFFIISGYFYYSGVLKKEYSITDIGKLCVNKYWRLYPAYLLSIILIFVVSQFVNLHGRECSLKDFIVNIFFVYHPTFSYVDSAHWFIAELIKLQIFSAFFLIMKPSRRYHIIMLFELFIFGLLIVSHFINHSLINKMVFILNPDCFLKFMVGYNFFEIINLQSKIKKLHIYLLIIILGYYCYMINIWLITIYAVVTYLILQNKYLPIVKNRNNPFLVIGKYSFTWYLIHQNIGFMIINQLNNWGLNNEMWLLVPMVVTLGLAVVIQYLISSFPRKIFA